MIGRVVEIAEDGRHLSLERGFLVVSGKTGEVGRVPLDGIAALIASAHGITWSNALMLELLERDVAVVMCGANHAPAALLWPIAGHHAQTARMRAQIEATEPLRKRLWQSLVKAKVLWQGAALAALGRQDGGLTELARHVRSGDPENVEAQAARRYWPLLMGGAFRRDPDTPGVNGLLNYGYAILRSGVARSVAASGLHPTLGLFHRNSQNPMVLVDDLMEPFRPLVDVLVARMTAHGVESVDKEAKRSLAALLTHDLATEEGTTPLFTVLIRLSQSLAKAYDGGEAGLAIPSPPTPLEWPIYPC